MINQVHFALLGQSLRAHQLRPLLCFVHDNLGDVTNVEVFKRHFLEELAPQAFWHTYSVELALVVGKPRLIVYVSFGLRNHLNQV